MDEYRGSTTKDISSREMKNSMISCQIAAEGMVLLKNDDHILPLSLGKRIGLFGDGAQRTLFCGMGAADVRIRKVTSVWEGLEQVGFEIANPQYLAAQAKLYEDQEIAFYKNVYEYAEGNAVKAYLSSFAHPFQAPVQPILTQEDIPEDTDVAVYVLSRVSGEGKDRTCTKGDYYLTDEEEKNLIFLGTHFKHLIVLLNTGSVIDTQWIDQIPGISAVLWIGLGGSHAGLAAAQVLAGIVPAQGKLVDTWAARFEDYPNALSYLGHSREMSDEDYNEQIFVGYRYFDTFGVKPAFGFGFGLTYTDFSVDFECAYANTEGIVLKVVVKNTGNVRGREVVQAYMTAPEGKQVKASRELKAFAKTRMLEPGENQLLTLTIPYGEMGFYCEATACWMIDQGLYIFSVGNSLDASVPVAGLWFDTDVVLQKCKNVFNAGTLSEIQPKKRHNLPKADGIVIVKADMSSIITKKYVYENPLLSAADKPEQIMRFNDVKDGRVTLDEFMAQLSPEEMAWLCVGNDAEKTPTKTPNMMDFVAIGHSTSPTQYKKWGIPRVNASDGAGGLRVTPELDYDEEDKVTSNPFFVIEGMAKAFKEDAEKVPEGSTRYYSYVVSIPIATQIAQTWDKDAMEAAGRIAAEDMREFGIGIWLAPAMNIHRNPMCGRNPEYFSEDPLVSGYAAGYIVRGVQSIAGYAATIKHMACNNQEDGRNNVSSNASERTIREIYMKGYEIAIRVGNPKAIMSSYNLINGIHAANHYGMLTDIVRNEWGYDGVIMTDWGTTGKHHHEGKYEGATASGCILAGNDLVMPGSQDDVEDIIEALNSGKLPVEKLRWCCKNVLRLVIDSFKMH